MEPHPRAHTLPAVTEWVPLRAQREELAGRTAERTLPPLPLGSLMEGWATGDPRTRRGLLDKLDDQYCGRSPGGIRTRDLSLERAAS